MHSKRLSLAIVTTAGLLGSLSAAQHPAAANTSTMGAAVRLTEGGSAAEFCAPGEMCMWEHPGHQGQIYRLRGRPGADRAFRDNPCTGCISDKHPHSNGTWDDQASALHNRSSFTYCFYYHPNYRGGSRRIPPGVKLPYLFGQDNEFSSVRSRGLFQPC